MAISVQQAWLYVATGYLYTKTVYGYLYRRLSVLCAANPCSAKEAAQWQ
jgi:hypothetical protein